MKSKSYSLKLFYILFVYLISLSLCADETMFNPDQTVVLNFKTDPIKCLKAYQIYFQGCNLNLNQGCVLRIDDFWEDQYHNHDYYKITEIYRRTRPCHDITMPLFEFKYDHTLYQRVANVNYNTGYNGEIWLKVMYQKENGSTSEQFAWFI